MPLKKIPKGATPKERRKIISDNISELVNSGNLSGDTPEKRRKQAVAIALEEARKDKRR